MNIAGETAITRVDYLSEPGLGRLVLKNFLLIIVTLGIYRFWARTKIRRYFWRNIVIDGEPLEYTGNGRELFVGFLIVIAVLAPLGIIYNWLLRVSLGNPMFQAGLQIVYVLVLGALIQAAIFRARRYRLSRTSWRGVAAGQGGSTWRYLGLSLVNGTLCAITLGLFAPWASVALERYKINNTSFGDARFGVEASGRDLFPQWLLIWVLCVVPIAIAIGANWHAFASAQAPLPHTPAAPPHPKTLFLIPLAYLGGILALFAYRVICFRYFASHSRLNDVHMRSSASAWTVIRRTLLYALIMIGMWLACILAFFALIALTAPGPAGGHVTQASALPPVLTVVSLGPLFICAIIASQVLTYVSLRAPILSHLATTFEIENLTAVDHIAQSSRPRQKFGEGLADSFEVAGL